MEHELDFLTYYRKMKQFEHALKVLFSSKERYLLRVQHDSTLGGDSSGSERFDDSVDSEDENGPRKNPEWW